MTEFFPVLRNCPLFQGVETRDLSGLLGCLRARALTFRKGQILFREGDPTDFVGIVLTGSIQVLREDYYGNRSMMGHVGPSELFGESYAFSGADSLPVTIQADADSLVMLLSSRNIAACCAKACDFHNRMIANLLRIVSQKNLMLHQKIQVTAQRTTREKLMAYLLNQAKIANSNRFTIPFDRQALADYLEVDRSGLSTEIGKLRKEGVLESHKRTFHLL